MSTDGDDNKAEEPSIEVMQAYVEMLGAVEAAEQFTRLFPEGNDLMHTRGMFRGLALGFAMSRGTLAEKGEPEYEKWAEVTALFLKIEMERTKRLYGKGGDNERKH